MGSGGCWQTVGRPIARSVSVTDIEIDSKTETTTGRWSIRAESTAADAVTEWL
jgi:hypothetical protein